LAHRELLSLFVTPLAYVVGTLFLLLQGYDFALLLRVLNDPLAAPGPVMQYYFGGSFFVFWLPVIFLCAALSMRLVAEERRQGTLEALLTAPIRPSQIICGKFVGALVFYVALWAPTLVFYVLLHGAAAEPDAGPILSGYLGTLLVGASFMAIGLVASTLARSQLAAAIATFVVCSILLLAGLLGEHVGSQAVTEAIEATSLLVMMQELAQGIVDGRWIWMHLAVVLSGLSIAAVVLDPRRTRERLVQAALLVVCLGNVAVFAARHSDRGDWTHSAMYTLSDRAEDVLANLSGPIHVDVLVPATIGGGRPNPLRQELGEVLARMAKVGPALRVRVIDPDRDRQQAERVIDDFGLGGRELADGVVLIRAGQGSDLRRAHLLPSDLVTYATDPDVQTTGPRIEAFRGEEALLAKLIEVSELERATVCYTQGHGEPERDNLEPYGGYAHLFDLLSEANLILRQADLDHEDGIAGCDVLMVAGPRGALPPSHVETIERHARDGGDLFLLTGAVVVRGKDRIARHGLEPLAERYGVRFGDRVVLDPHGMPGSTPLLAFTIDDGWGDHPAVRPLIGRPVSFVLARELTLEPPPDGGGPASVLVQAGEEAWAESDLGGLEEVGGARYDEGVDRRGPIPVAAAGQWGGSRMVVVASDELALNANLREDVAYDYGRDLILNAMGWLTRRDLMLGIRARQREHVKLVLLPEQLRRMTLVCLVGPAGFFVGLGLLVLWRRRR